MPALHPAGVIHRKHRMLAVPRGGHVRVSFCALLRVHVDSRYVLFHTTSRPGAYAPPGGVFKYYEPAVSLLDELGFQPERTGRRGVTTHSDLRSVLPGKSIRNFCGWFASGAYREDAAECLSREMAEELGEIGFHDFAAGIRDVPTVHVRTVIEGPYAVPGHAYQQLRRIEIYDLVNADGPAVRLRKQLFSLAELRKQSGVILATAAEIMHGRCGTALITPHTPYLLGSRRTSPDLPGVL
jgi:hypothetical protein